MYSRGLIWFREDLRITDNKALYHAARQCRGGLIGIYLLDASAWRAHDMAACRVEFLLRGLQSLSDNLAKLHIPLLIHHVASSADIAKIIEQQLHNSNAQQLFFNRQYEIDEQHRDRAVVDHLTARGYACYSYDDQTILPPLHVTTQQGGFFKVFTPFKRAWLHAYTDYGETDLLPAPKSQPNIDVQSSNIPKYIDEFHSQIDANLWPAGESAAQQHLQQFITHKLSYYDKQRDFPAIDGTSQLSPYLATGMISARQCFHAALNANKQQSTDGNAGALTWMSELIWREFYKQILLTTPRVSMHRAYQLHTEKLQWHFNEALLIAWQQGNTGYPLIDAAMRQLNTTGWMHNRLRMVVAMFFSKNLFFDWRLGERYFMQHLIDGDLAANNGGWQWSASTGTDAAPYFRVFNCVRQSERFDPEGKFIRRYCPELAVFDNKSIHDPSHRAPELLQQCGYPPAIVDLETSRKHAIAMFKRLTD